MKTTGNVGNAAFRLKFVGKMTHAFYREQEDRIISAMRCHKALEIDLSEIEEVDLWGLHLIGLLQNVGSIVAASPAVTNAADRLLSSQQAAALGRVVRRERVAV